MMITTTNMLEEETNKHPQSMIHWQVWRDSQQTGLLRVPTKWEHRRAVLAWSTTARCAGMSSPAGTCKVNISALHACWCWWIVRFAYPLEECPMLRQSRDHPGKSADKLAHQVGLMLNQLAHLHCLRPPVACQSPLVYLGCYCQLVAARDPTVNIICYLLFLVSIESS